MCRTVALSAVSSCSAVSGGAIESSTDWAVSFITVAGGETGVSAVLVRFSVPLCNRVRTRALAVEPSIGLLGVAVVLSAPALGLSWRVTLISLVLASMTCCGSAWAGIVAPSLLCTVSL